jgi:chromosome segregation ATPase
MGKSELAAIPDTSESTDSNVAVNEIAKYCDEIRARLASSNFSADKSNSVEPQPSKSSLVPTLIPYTRKTSVSGTSEPANDQAANHADDDYEARLENSNSEIKQLLETLQDSVTSLNTEKADQSVDHRIDVLTAALKQSNNEFAKSQIESSVRENSLKRELGGKNSEISERDNTIAELKSEIMKLKEKNYQLNKEVDGKSDDLSAVKMEQLRLKEFGQKMEVRFRDAELQRSKATRDLEKAKSGETKFQDSIVEQASEISKLRQVIKQHENDAVQQNETVQFQKQQLQELNGEISCLKEEMLRYRSEAVTYREVAEKSKTIATVHKKMHASKLSIKEQEVQRLRAENDSLRGKLCECREIIQKKISSH